MTRAIAASISVRIESYCALRSTNGTVSAGLSVCIGSLSPALQGPNKTTTATTGSAGGQTKAELRPVTYIDAGFRASRPWHAPEGWPLNSVVTAAQEQRCIRLLRDISRATQVTI